MMEVEEPVTEKTNNQFTLLAEGKTTNNNHCTMIEIDWVTE